MPVTLDATVGGANANSYLTPSGADAYFNLRPHTTTWDGQTTDNKKRGLIRATQLLDTYFSWKGISTSGTVQALQFPRDGLVDAFGEDLSAHVIPVEIQNATAELAQFVLASDRTAESGAGQYDAIKLGPIDVDFADESRQDKPVIPKHVLGMVRRFGRLVWGGANRKLRRV